VEGHHEKIRQWRKKQALVRTLQRRPDLLRDRRLDPETEKLLEEIRSEGHPWTMEKNDERAGTN